MVTISASRAKWPFPAHFLQNFHTVSCTTETLSIALSKYCKTTPNGWCTIFPSRSRNIWIRPHRSPSTEIVCEAVGLKAVRRRTGSVGRLFERHRKDTRWSRLPRQVLHRLDGRDQTQLPQRTMGRILTHLHLVVDAKIWFVNDSRNIKKWQIL